jgi:isocitrate dehydrogenase
VNQYRLRFETDVASPLTQADILDLYSALSKDFKISSLEILNMWGDKKAYSLAQGQ